MSLVSGASVGIAAFAASIACHSAFARRINKFGPGSLNHIRKCASTSTRKTGVSSTPQVAGLISSVDTFVFDCDGVIWRGDRVIPGAIEALHMLRTAGKRVFFVTNNASKSRQGNLEKFTKLGIHATHEEVICSSFAAALYLSNIGFQATGKKVYVVGASGPGEELDLVGIPHLGGPEDGSQTIDLKNQKDVVIDPNVGAVVVGFDPMFNYYKLQYAQLCLNGDPQCLFIATNEDAVGHFTPNQEWAGAGSMVGALKGCTHRSPIVVGKPNSVIVEYIVNKYNLSPARMCMVGDRLDTDILFGRNHGMRTCLTLSGVTSIEKVTSEENNTHPDFMVNSLQDFVC